MTGILWTSEEKERFRRLWPSATPQKLREAFPNRNPSQLKNAAHRYQIKRKWKNWKSTPLSDPLIRDLKAAREKAGLTQYQLSAIIGCGSQHDIANYERGLKGFSVFVLRAWCDALGLELRAKKSAAKKVRKVPLKLVPLPERIKLQAKKDMERWREKNQKRGEAA